MKLIDLMVKVGLIEMNNHKKEFKIEQPLVKDQAVLNHKQCRELKQVIEQVVELHQDIHKVMDNNNKIQNHLCHILKNN